MQGSHSLPDYIPDGMLLGASSMFWCFVSYLVGSIGNHFYTNLAEDVSQARYIATLIGNSTMLVRLDS